MKLDRKTIQYDEEYLRQVSEEIDFECDDYSEYIRRLREYCQSNRVYALAPVQIGIPKKIIYIRNSSESIDNNDKTGYDEGIVYINPTILKSSGKTKFLEACASCAYKKGDETIYYASEVERPYSCEVEYYDMKGQKRKKVIEGFEATVFSHEFDHLLGTLHIDKCDNIQEMTWDEMKEYRSDHPYEIISKT